MKFIAPALGLASGLGFSGRAPFGAGGGGVADRAPRKSRTALIKSLLRTGAFE